MTATILKVIGIVLTAVSALVFLLAGIAALMWFRFPRFSKAVGEAAYRIATLFKWVAHGAAKVAASPFIGAKNRFEILRQWAARTFRRSNVRIATLSGCS